MRRKVKEEEQKRHRGKGERVSDKFWEKRGHKREEERKRHRGKEEKMEERREVAEEGGRKGTL